MVQQGQYLERPTLLARVAASETSPGLTLEGLFHRGERAPAVVLCAPHPWLGGSMDSPVVAELAWAFTRAGHATLRFNYQGVGASQGKRKAPAPGQPGLTIEAVESEIGDALAAVGQLAASTAHRRIALCGYSFGAAVALGLALARPELSPVVLVAPPTQLFDFSPLATYDGPLWIAAGAHDPLVDSARLAGLVRGRPLAQLELFPASDHSFTRGLTELGARAAAWLDGRPLRP